jgi:hypothetical protein
VPTLLEHTECPTCGRRHHFCLTVGEMAVGRPYQFVCPEKGAQAYLRVTAPGRAVAFPPQGAVQLNPAPEARSGASP